MDIRRMPTSAVFSWWSIAILSLAISTSSAFGQNPTQLSRVWSVGPLLHPQPVIGVSFGKDGATITPPRVDSQTESVFTATRSMAFAGDRIVIAFSLGMQSVTGGPVPLTVYRLLSLDVRTGAVKDSRELKAFGSLGVFGTDDGHVIISGRDVERLTPELKDAGTFDYLADGHKFGNVENMSPDGSTLGNATSPGFELINSRTLKARQLTASPAVATSVSSKGFITDNVHWVRDFPRDIGFITYTDSSGEHLVYHARCGGRPQFLTEGLILEPGCKRPLVFDTKGDLVTTLPVKGAFSFGGVSQDGQRFALQVASFSGMHDLRREQFVIYSIKNWLPIARIIPDEQPEEQSWTAFSPDGTMFLVGSPLKLTLYHLPQ